MAKITKDDIERKAQYIRNLGDKMFDEEDVNVVIEIAKIMQQESEELKTMALAFEQQEQEAHPPHPRAKAGFDIVLTQKQKDAVFKETGIKMDILFMRDSTGNLNAQMIYTSQEEVERWALAEARRRKGTAQARIDAVNKARELVQSIADEAASQDVIDELEKLLADPEFMGGLLYGETFEE